MASSPNDLPIHHFLGRDGAQLAYREVGSGRPLILIHGLFSNGWVNWVRYGTAQHIADAGFRVIMPDLRGHGASAAPHDPAAYPPDILMRDAEALVDYLHLTDYDLGGYSLGGRTVVRMLANGASPRRAIVAGMGLQGLHDTGHRAGFFRDVLNNAGTHPRGSGAWLAEGFLKTTGGDPAAMLPLLDSFVDTTTAELAGIDIPVLVLSGREDQDNGSAGELAQVLPQGRLSEIPGNHMTAVLRPELGSEIAAFLLRD
ncbi:alpha/beta fold hydrolase [uncultured Sphingomonas sp.]|uniref:alpha/beta fold hydrolase n=1 Tax=uncultured Sphingomonas sp. TaxID=158754 RepID=UPI0025DF38B4|nr:alpha/beta fold hydrolase [uncultured Sphingomonas sp.]